MTRPAIVEEFLELVQIESHSFKERLLADALTTKLKALGFTVEEDDTGSKINGNAGNLIARLAGDPSAPSILFSAHMDRVDNHGHIKPVVLENEDTIKSDGTSILAADDISGVCAILDGVRRVQADSAVHGDIEIVFSVAEEVGLLGARHLDYSKLKSKMGYVIDSSGPLGTLINQAPTQYTFEIKVHGRSAHAGMALEDGISAIRVAAVALSRLKEGRLTPTTTSNFGLIQGGRATNIVADYAQLKAEVRSTQNEEIEKYLTEVKKVFAETAAEFEASFEMEANLEYTTFKVDEQSEIIRIAERAMKNVGLTIDVHGAGGGMDGNFFNQHGLQAVGISPDYRKVHTSDEEQPISALIKCGEMVAELIKEAARAKA